MKRNQYGHIKAGKRDDLGGIRFRSAWEANYARYLNMLQRMGAVVSWEYEPEIFWFEGIKRGTNNYTPDFKVWYKGDPVPVYIEVKGYEVPKDRTKWKRMAKYHPGIKLVIVRRKEYDAIKRQWRRSIPHWE